MEKCECWHCGTCWGTKECEECTCDGDESKCNFYPQKRKENKTMNTAEMWIKAQEDGLYYKTSTIFGEKIFYQKDRGLFNEDNEYCPTDFFGIFDNLMEQEWERHGGFLTKSEAEAKFNIKIVGD